MLLSLDWESGETLSMGVSVWAWKVTVPPLELSPLVWGEVAARPLV